MASAALRDIYARLSRAYGPQHWWPAETATETVVGAILTQNTAWTNVERAIASLKAAERLTWRRLYDVPEAELADLIRPSGTYRVKARRLKAFVGVVCNDFDASLDALLSGPLEHARERLLAIHGIGPETADAILLYAGQRASFVIDAYTRRVLRRHHLVSPNADYETIRQLFHASLEPDAQVYNEYHALLVQVGKRHCRAAAHCDRCPLDDLPHDTPL